MMTVLRNRALYRGAAQSAPKTPTGPKGQTESAGTHAQRHGTATAGDRGAAWGLGTKPVPAPLTACDGRPASPWTVPNPPGSMA
jgi:hypothetical protein